MWAPWGDQRRQWVSKGCNGCPKDATGVQTSWTQVLHNLEASPAQPFLEASPAHPEHPGYIGYIGCIYTSFFGFWPCAASFVRPCAVRLVRPCAVCLVRPGKLRNACALYEALYGRLYVVCTAFVRPFFAQRVTWTEIFC